MVTVRRIGVLNVVGRTPVRIKASRLVVSAPILQVLVLSVLGSICIGPLVPLQFRVQSLTRPRGIRTNARPNFSPGSRAPLTVRLNGMLRSRVVRHLDKLTSGPEHR